MTGWYCTCKAGMRTVGCCAHIAAVIWYLAIARYDKHKFLRACNVSMEDIIDSRSIGDLSEGDNEADEGGAYEADEGDVSEEDQEGGIEQVYYFCFNFFQSHLCSSFRSAGVLPGTKRTKKRTDFGDSAS